MRRSVAAIATAVVLLLNAAGSSPALGQDAWPPPDCVPAGPEWAPQVDRLACVVLDSAAVGGLTPVVYHVPAVCADRACPVVYNLHGFSGDYTSQLGPPGSPGAWISAIDHRPPADPTTSDEPWTLADPETWVPTETLPLIQVTTHGRTVPGGYGPRDGLDGFYSDWNPRYAQNGADQRYDTPPPRFESFLVDELLPFVEQRFPTHTGRRFRAITGVSLGGFGSFKLGLAHPDLFAAVGSVSGAHNFLFAPAADDSDVPDTSAPFVVDLGGILLPSTTGGATLPLGPAEGFTVPFTAYGDTVADQPYFRGNMPVDLARNGRAYTADGAQMPVFTAIVNDAVPRQQEDVTDPGGFAGAFALEAIVLAMNQDMELAWDQQAVERTFAIHPGLHSGDYWNPWIRQHLEQLASALAAPGVPGVDPSPEVFDHRSISSDYAIWDWAIQVDRDTVEFLDLTDVSCDSITLRGTGTVTVDVPDRCGTGLAVEDDVLDPFQVELGAGGPTPGPTGLNPGAKTLTLALTEQSGSPPASPSDGEGPAPPHGGRPDAPLPATGTDGGRLAVGIVAAAAALWMARAARHAIG